MNSVVSARLWLMSKICTFFYQSPHSFPFGPHSFHRCISINQVHFIWVFFFEFIFFFVFWRNSCTSADWGEGAIAVHCKGYNFWYVAFISIAHHSNAAHNFPVFFFFLSLFFCLFLLSSWEICTLFCAVVHFTFDSSSRLNRQFDWSSHIFDRFYTFFFLFKFIFIQKFGCNLAINSGPQIKKFKKTKQTIKIISSFLQFSLFFFSFYFHHKMFFSRKIETNARFKCVSVLHSFWYMIISMHRSEMKDQFKQGTK